MDFSTVYAVILCGGQSRRFGRDKALLTLHGESLLEILARTLRSHFDDVFFVSDVRDKFHGVDIPYLVDEIPGQGPLGGIYTGLGVCRGDYCFVTACDTPFLGGDVIQALRNEIQGEDVIVPRYQGLVEPLVGFYACRCRDGIRDVLQSGERQTRALLTKFRVRQVNLDDRFSAEYLRRVFWNINTAADYDAAKDWR